MASSEEGTLGLSDFALELAECTVVVMNVDSCLLFVLSAQIVEDKREIVSSSTEIVDEVEFIGTRGVCHRDRRGWRRRRWVRRDTEDGQTSHGTSVLGGLMLGIIEVGGDGDDGGVTFWRGERQGVLDRQAGC